MTTAASESVAIAVVASKHRDRVRLGDALADREDFIVLTGASPRQLLASDSTCVLLVLHCEAVDPKALSLFTGLRTEFSGLSIIVVCESANGRSARRAMDAGVDGLVFADDMDAALLPTVAAVLAGQIAVPRELRASVRKASLSFREKQILGMVVMGFTNGEIGARLYLAESTVKSHLSSAFSKLGVRSRNEAAAVILDPNGSLGTGILAITRNDWTPPA